MSVAGSMAHITPEVISRQGYAFSPDWWLLGVTLYEGANGPSRSNSPQITTIPMDLSLELDRVPTRMKEAVIDFSEMNVRQRTDTPSS